MVYKIALSVNACLRSGTRVDVAWCLTPEQVPQFDATDAVAVTPGGGRLGSLLDGAIDSRLVELSQMEASEGRVVNIELDEHEAAVVGVEPGTPLSLFYAPADSLPGDLWPHLLGRSPISLEIDLDGDRATASRLADAPSTTGIVMTEDRLVCHWCPTPTLLIYGGGPMADALGHAATFVGWSVERSGGTEAAVAMATSLSSIDGVVVMGHDTEGVGRVLQAALGSGACYIGSIGPASLQEDRGDWLAYRGVDSGRVHGPAGFNIGANSPEEVALSVVVEMIAVRNA